MKRTNIEIDEHLVDEGLKATGLGSMKALVDRALRDLVRRERQKRLLRLKGTVAWEGDLPAMRRGRTA
jgi:Arc/MetJ family transcription regulator